MKKSAFLVMALLAAAAAQASEITTQARVLRSEPVYGAGRQQCWDEPAQAQQRSSGDNMVGQVVGGVVGGVLGNQFGKGTGKTVATAGGAIAGAVVGGRVATTGDSQGGGTVRRCSNGGREIVAYNVVYEYQGEQFNTRMSRAPGDSITVRVRQDVIPLDR